MTAAPRGPGRSSGLAASPAADQRELDFLVPYRKPLLTTSETCACLRLNKGSVIALLDDARLEAHRHAITGEKLSNRITRRSVILYLAATANYDPARFGESLLTLIDAISDPQLLARIAAAATARRTRI